MLVRDGAAIPQIGLAQSTKDLDWTKLDLAVFAADASEANGVIFLPKDERLRRLALVKKGESYADSLEKLKVPGYTIYNASVFYKIGKTELALNLKNLTNRQYYGVPTFSGALPGEPRQLLLTLRTKF